jgi:putative DNA primase/helicase
VSSLRAIARALGGAVVGRDQVVAPGPGHSRTDRSLSIKISATSPDGFIAHSHAGDDWIVCREYVKALLGITQEPRRAGCGRPADRPSVVDRRDDDEHRGRIIASILDEIVPLRGSPGEAFLRDVRRIDVDAIADVLDQTDAIGWHPAVPFRQEGHPLDGKRLGCIIGVMTDPTTAKPTGGISRTYVHQGIKIAKAKGRGPAGIVRLTPDEDTLGGLHLAEGLESALDAMSKNLRPMWSTGSASILAKFPILSGIEFVTIIADHDENGTGQKAANELKRRNRAAGRQARAWISTAPGDFNDISMRASQ